MLRLGKASTKREDEGMSDDDEQVGRLDRVLDVVAERPVVDYAVAGVLVAAHLALVLRTGHGDVLSWADEARRKDVYTAFIGFITFIGGFGTLALSVYTAANGTRVSRIRSQAGRELRRSLLAALAAPVLVAVVLLVVVTLDTTRGDAGGTRFVAEAAIFFGLVRLVRLGLVLKSLIIADDLDRAEPARDAAPRPALALTDDEEVARHPERREYGLPPQPPRRRPRTEGQARPKTAAARTS